MNSEFRQVSEKLDAAFDALLDAYDLTSSADLREDLNVIIDHLDDIIVEEYYDREGA